MKYRNLGKWCGVYILSCRVGTNVKYYIGYSGTDIFARLQTHFEGIKERSRKKTRPAIAHDCKRHNLNISSFTVKLDTILPVSEANKKQAEKRETELIRAFRKANKMLYNET